MVKVGFVVEGPSEKKLIESANFRELCSRLGIEICTPIILIGGVGDTGRDITGFISDCRNQAKPERVLVLVDLENAACFTGRKEKLIGWKTADRTVLAKRNLEAWFMADTEAFARWAENKGCVPFPEMYQDNFAWLKELCNEIGLKRGTGVDHLSFAKVMLNKHDFSLERAAQHPHCSSAQYLLDTLKAFSSV